MSTISYTVRQLEPAQLLLQVINQRLRLCLEDAQAAHRALGTGDARDGGPRRTSRRRALVVVVSVSLSVSVSVFVFVFILLAVQRARAARVARRLFRTDQTQQHPRRDELDVEIVVRELERERFEPGAGVRVRGRVRGGGLGGRGLGGGGGRLVGLQRGGREGLLDDALHRDPLVGAPDVCGEGGVGSRFLGIGGRGGGSGG